MMTKEALILQQKGTLIEGIRKMEIQKKALEAKEREMRDELLKSMQEYGVWDIDNGSLKITRIPATTRDTVDTKKLKAEFPTLAQKVMKTSNVKESLRFKVQ